MSFLDETFKDWLARTGELPPDFDQMPTIPLLPDPLVLDEGAKNVPVITMEQWKEKREWMKRQLEYYITGTRPPEPDNLKATVLGEQKDGETTLCTVELTFGPENRATLTIELMIPPGRRPISGSFLMRSGIIASGPRSPCGADTSVASMQERMVKTIPKSTRRYGLGSTTSRG